MKKPMTKEDIKALEDKTPLIKDMEVGDVAYTYIGALMISTNYEAFLNLHYEALSERPGRVALKVEKTRQGFDVHWPHGEQINRRLKLAAEDSCVSVQLFLSEEGQ